MADFYLGKKLRLNPSLKCNNYYVLHVACFSVFLLEEWGWCLILTFLTSGRLTEGKFNVYLYFVYLKTISLHSHSNNMYLTVSNLH